MPLTWRVISASLLIVLGAMDSAGSRAAQLPVMRLTTSERAPSADHDRRRTQRCVATKIAAHWALTVSHCLPEAADPQVFKRHPTHDIALVRVTTPEFRALPIMQLSAAAAPTQRTYALRLPTEGTFLDATSDVSLAYFHPSRATQLSLQETSRTPHVLRLHSSAPCLEPGDSGTPVLSADAIVGVLISGSPNCPGTQTVVRIESLLPWLHSQTTDQESEHAQL